MYSYYYLSNNLFLTNTIISSIVPVFILFIFIIVYALFKGKKAEANPWGEGAKTLEWTLPSPPPYHQFDTLPEVKN